MKNFDLEKLERKNIYAVPPGSFDAMQSRVLGAAGHIPREAKSGRIIPMKWFYAAAAVLVLLLGFGFLLNQNTQQAEKIPVIAKAEPSPSVEHLTPAVIEEEPLITTAPAMSEPVKEIAAVEPVKKRHSTKIETPIMAKNGNVKEEKTVLADEKQDYLSKEELTEQIISELSGQEIAELAKNTEQDVYLELYN